MTMKQMKLLGDFIMECVEGEPSQSEGVGDPAIRIIKQLQAELAEAKKRIVLSEAQNYCKICGNTLDGYVPPEKENKDGKY